MLRNYFPKIYVPCFCGSEKNPQKSRKISREISLQQKKITNELLQERRENIPSTLENSLASETGRKQENFKSAPKNARGVLSKIEVLLGVLTRVKTEIRADFWEGDATKHFPVKKRVFQ